MPVLRLAEINGKHVSSRYARINSTFQFYAILKLLNQYSSLFIYVLILDGQPTQIRICDRPYVNSTASSIIFGSLESPGYPSGYVGHHDCTVAIEIPPMSWVGVYTFEDFQIREADNGCDDFVSIKNPHKPKATDPPILCGNILPDTLLYSGSSQDDNERINVRFHSDGNKQDDTHERFSISFKGNCQPPTGLAGSIGNSLVCVACFVVLGQVHQTTNKTIWLTL